jgi:hypothetical protein
MQQNRAFLKRGIRGASACSEPLVRHGTQPLDGLHGVEPGGAHALLMSAAEKERPTNDQLHGAGLALLAHSPR